MIVSRTPFRVSLFGGGSDYPKWFREHGGAVVGFTIDKYCYLSVRALPPFFEHKHRIVYSRIELANSIGEIQHPAVRNILADLGHSNGIEIHHHGDLPARSGLGSSSSFTVGLLNALHAMGGRMVSKGFLAREAIRIEQDVIRENVGSQDQVWAAYGGMNRIEFLRDGTFDVRPLIVDPTRRQELIGSFMLVFTGLSRLADGIAADKIANLDKRTAQIHRLTEMVEESTAILRGTRPLSEIGHLLHESWQVKRELADSVTTPLVDEIYQAARDAGALGGKLLGAGGGGFMLFYVEPANRARVHERLSNLIHVNINIDQVGSKIVIYEPDGLDSC